MAGPEPIPGCTVPGTHIWGWMIEVELHWLMGQAAQMDSVVEVGSLHGRSAFALLTACKGPVTCVDTWSDDHDKSFPSFMGACGHFENLIALRMWSHEAAATFKDLSVDMVFLDGSHAYESVIADIANWLPKVRKLLCGHDYHLGPDAGFPGVGRAVHEVFGDRVQVGEGTSIWWVDVEADRSVAAGLPSGLLEFTDEYQRPMALEVSW